VVKALASGASDIVAWVRVPLSSLFFLALRRCAEGCSFLRCLARSLGGNDGVGLRSD
jgi:hypothetical protein